MIDIISSYTSQGIDTRGRTTQEPIAVDPANPAHPSDQFDFQAMVESDGFEDSADLSITSVSRNGFLQLAQNVDQSKANMQSALLQASVTNQPEVLQRAATALSRYDLQTLFLSKVANKAFQAVDRLTNLQ